MIAFFKYLLQFFQQYNIPYMLSGSVAMSVYVLPRSTRDFDFIVHLQQKDIPLLVRHFKEGYYCDEDAANEAVKTGGMFNIIDHASGYKADFVILKNEPFRITEFNRRIQADFFGVPVYIVSAEDLLLSKLIWIQQIKSSVQEDDIKNLSMLPSLDYNYINYWIGELKLNTFALLKND